MKFQNVCVEAVVAGLPEGVVTSAQIEARLAPLYERIRLPEGRLELMSGIRERRFFPPGTRIGELSAQTAAAALARADFPPSAYGACLHGSVCRDFLEPATACGVHHALGLDPACLTLDLSNACLGILSGALLIATMIEGGQIDAGVVVGTECGRSLVDNTIDRLNADTRATRESVKGSFASLTIGSASAAMVLCHNRLSRTGNRLVAAAQRAETAHHKLCQSEGLSHVMQTDSEALLHAGVATGVATFESLLAETGWSRDSVDRSFCHQVGVAHRRLLLQGLGLSVQRDYGTVEWLGNTGSAALPSALALGVQEGVVGPGERVALLGIGSGINCLMMGIEWGANGHG